MSRSISRNEGAAVVSNSNPVLDVARRTSLRLRDYYYGVLKPRSRIELALDHLGFSSIALCDFARPITSLLGGADFSATKRLGLSEKLEIS